MTDKSPARQALEAKLEPFWGERAAWGLDISDGWLPLVDQLVDDLLAVGPFELFQVKEKFGGLRFYASGATALQQALISVAESASTRTCEACGETGSTVSIFGWYRTLCDADAAIAQQKAEDRRAELRAN
jgi:hypothetical protein